jgi:surface protein
MFAGTACPHDDTPDPQSLLRDTFCTACQGSITTAPSPSPPDLSDGSTGKPFTTTDELINAVDVYILDSSSTSDVATQYGYPIGNWDVSQISDFSKVFSAIRNPNMYYFDADLSGWDLTSAEATSSMFQGTISFTDITNSLAGWNVAKVIDMSRMFDSSGFAGDISQWQVGSVKDFSFFAEFATSFQSDLSGWNVASAKEMGWMFRGAKSFSSDVSGWNTASVVTFTNMYVVNWRERYATRLAYSDPYCLLLIFRFAGITSFNQDLCPWGQLVRGDADTRSMFAATSCPVTEEPASTAGPWCMPC